MIRITFTGDVMCEHTRLNHFYSDGTYDFYPIFEDVVPVFKKSDYVVANLETPLAGKDMVYTERNYSFNTPEQMAEALKKSGVNLATTANNHVLDRGIAGLERTLDVLDQNGIAHTGSYRENEKSQPFITDIGGVRVAFLSYTYGTEACFNNNYLTKEQYNMVNLTRNQELSNPLKRYFLVNKGIPAKAFRLVYRTVSPKKARMDVSERKENDTYQIRHLISDIQSCKDAGADCIVMCLHCGGQFNEEPTAYTKKIVKLCLDNGVHAVVTNHEHRIQRAWFTDNRAVTYCLGNFTSDYGIYRKPMGSHAEYSALFHLYLDKNDEIIPRYSVTFLKSHLNEEGVIVTSPISQLYENCEDEKVKEELMKDNLWCLNTFFNLSAKQAPVREEYFADEWAFRK